jgi:hypothetical protein
MYNQADANVKMIAGIARHRRDQKFRHAAGDAALLKKRRPHMERFMNLFDQRFNATRTQCRNFRNYVAGGWTRAMAHNAPRFINKENGWPLNLVAHLRKVG